MKINHLPVKGQFTGRNHFTNDFSEHQAVVADIGISLRWIRIFTYGFLVIMSVTTFFIINGLG